MQFIFDAFNQQLPVGTLNNLIGWRKKQINNNNTDLKLEHGVYVDVDVDVDTYVYAMHRVHWTNLPWTVRRTNCSSVQMDLSFFFINHFSSNTRLFGTQKYFDLKISKKKNNRDANRVFVWRTKIDHWRNQVTKGGRQWMEMKKNYLYTLHHPKALQTMSKLKLCFCCWLRDE